MPLLGTRSGDSVYAYGRNGGLPQIIATGGTITTGGGFRYHTFNSSGTFAVTFAPAASTVSVFLIGAGTNGIGQSGLGYGADGGGGGYYLSVPPSGISISATNYAITVGAPSTGASIAFGYDSLNSANNASAGSAGLGVTNAGTGSAGGAGVLTNFNALLGAVRYGGGGGGGGGNNGPTNGYAGGASYGGAGGAVGANGSAANGPGGGGGGGGANFTSGGAAAAGTVIVKYVYA